MHCWQKSVLRDLLAAVIILVPLLSGITLAMIGAARDLRGE
ncbi:hypothetical protein GLS_c23060 [Gluconobacter oxydans DSM 3504]|uniref:Uncharacterized protein n=1 Tax=Gluconobacter oxydans DSM 3504 TaxID=1288313 RepID=A0A067Z7C5_GLUOY|nr:hypothetical protein GLS_c23060 [Gluconobacter oxydans DSM 3504]